MCQESGSRGVNHAISRYTHDITEALGFVSGRVSIERTHDITDAFKGMEAFPVFSFDPTMRSKDLSSIVLAYGRFEGRYFERLFATEQDAEKAMSLAKIPSFKSKEIYIGSTTYQQIE